MKALIETSTKEIIATVYYAPKLDEEGQKIWADEKNAIVRCVQKVDSFKWHEPTNNGYIVVNIKATEVKALAKFIEEQEKIESDEFWD